MKLLLAFLLLASPTWAAFPDGWGRKCKLTIQASKVPETQTNHPVPVDENCLPSEIFAAGAYPALDGGGDIRFSSDASGSTRLSCEVVSWDSTNSTCEVYTKIPSISSSVNTDFYIWYNKAGESQPARDAAYGSEDVWSNSYAFVYHLEEEQAGMNADLYTEETSNSNVGDDSVSATGQDGQLGNGQQFDDTDDCIYVPYHAALEPTTSLTLSVWVKRDGALDQYDEVCHKSISEGDDPPYLLYSLQESNHADRDSLRFNLGHPGGGLNTIDTYAPMTDATWYYYAMSFRNAQDTLYSWQGDAGTLYEVKEYDNNNSLATDNTDDLYIGAFFQTNQTIRHWGGYIDEVRLSDVGRTKGWIETAYNGQYNPSTFIIEGTPEDGPGAAGAAYIPVVK